MISTPHIYRSQNLAKKVTKFKFEITLKIFGLDVGLNIFAKLEHVVSESSFQENFKKLSLFDVSSGSQKIVGNIQPLLRDRRDTYANYLKCNFAIILRHIKLKFCPWGFQACRIETTDKLFIDGMVEKL